MRLPLTSLLLLQQQGFDEVALPCAACFNRFRSAVRELRRDPHLKHDLEADLGVAFHDGVAVLSLLDLLQERVGWEAVAERVRQPLAGLKVACYYGCLLTRPPAVTGSTEAEYPMAMDRLMRALGAEPVTWDSKVSCCGASLSLTNTDIVLEMSSAILDNARARGADMVAVACPLCHANLDGRQMHMDAPTSMPVLFFTQLMALALGLKENAALERNLVDPYPVLSARGVL